MQAEAFRRTPAACRSVLTEKYICCCPCSYIIHSEFQEPYATTARYTHTLLSFSQPVCARFFIKVNFTPLSHSNFARSAERVNTKQHSRPRYYIRVKSHASHQQPYLLRLKYRGHVLMLNSLQCALERYSWVNITISCGYSKSEYLPDNNPHAVNGIT